MRWILFGTMAAVAASAQSVDKLQLLNVRAETATYRGKSGIHLTPAAGAEGKETMAIVAGPAFQDGTIEIDLAGAPAEGAAAGARGFIGVAFRVAGSGEKFEVFYLRPTNGRADDQLRRNHSTQYASFPDWPWPRTRSETPGLYESYVDLEPAVWTKVKIVVAGLFIGPGTDGYFANLRVTAGH